MATLSVVIPALNEEDGIEEVVNRVLSAREGLKAEGIDNLELIVVDDGSSDRTPQILGAMDDVRLIRHPVNRGYGAALKTGFAAATGEWLGFLDADGTYPPEYFPKLCRAAQDQNADIIIGSRMAGSDSQMPLVRRIGNTIFANLVSLISADRITDSASGMRVFKKSILERIYPLPDGLNLTPVMSTRALHEDLRMFEVPIPYSERQGRSKLSVVRDGTRFAQSIVWTALSYNPGRILGMFGLACLVLAAVIGVGLVGLRMSGVTEVSSVGAFVLYSALVLSVTGISILALGVSFNYFVALFYKEPIRQGLWGSRSRSQPRFDRHFGWVGLLSLLFGIGIGAGSLGLAATGLTLSQLWIYFLGSASMTLVGIQLLIAWVQMQVLVALNERESLIANDMNRNGVETPVVRRSSVAPVPVKEGFVHG
ncbi:glycosyltransferase [bacterium]|nr:glycosyltransferase [bacterium]